jgi:uncharacterized protein DUF6894
MRYFFHFDSENKVDDHEGEEFESFEEARQYARRVAFELGIHKPAEFNRSSWIRVMDEAGKEIFSTTLLPATPPPHNASNSC